MFVECLYTFTPVGLWALFYPQELKWNNLLVDCLVATVSFQTQGFPGQFLRSLSSWVHKCFWWIFNIIHSEIWLRFSSSRWCAWASMNTRRRHGPRNSQEGVYLGPAQTQSPLIQPQDPQLTAPSPPPPPPLVDISNMSGRDRTNEFQSVCRSLQGRQVSNMERPYVF